MERTLFKDDPVDTTFKEIKVADIDNLIPDAANIITQPTPAFCESVKLHGVLVPILLIKRARGEKYDIAEGRRRIIAAKKAGLEKISARIFPAGYNRRHEITITANEQRQHNVLDEYKALEHLMGDGDTEEDIICKTGLSRKRLQVLLSLRNLIPELKTAFEGGKIKASVALRCAKQKAQIQKKLAATLADEGTLHATDIKEVRKAVKQDAVQSLSDSTLFRHDPDEWRDRATNTLGTLRQQIEADAPADWLADLDRLIALAKGG